MVRPLLSIPVISSFLLPQNWEIHIICLNLLQKFLTQFYDNARGTWRPIARYCCSKREVSLSLWQIAIYSFYGIIPRKWEINLLERKMNVTWCKCCSVTALKKKKKVFLVVISKKFVRETDCLVYCGLSVHKLIKIADVKSLFFHGSFLLKYSFHVRKLCKYYLKFKSLLWFLQFDWASRQGCRIMRI